MPLILSRHLFLFQDKYAAVIATSIHFYDHNAISYVHGICDDLGMNYIDAFSAGTFDLTKKAQRNTLELFAEHLFETIAEQRPTFKTYPPITPQSFNHCT